MRGGQGFTRLPSTETPFSISATGRGLISAPKQLNPPGRWTVFKLTCVYAAYGLVVGTMALEILPSEASRLYPDNESFMLGILLATVGVSQLACPAAGQLSDKRVGSVLHRRGVLMVACSVLAGGAVGWMALASLSLRPVQYVLSLLLAMTALNVVQSAQSGIVPDLVPQSVQSTASVMVALNSLGGGVAGFFLTWFAAKWNYHFIYPLYVILLLGSVVIELVTAMGMEHQLLQQTLPTLTVEQQAVEDLCDVVQDQVTDPEPLAKQPKAEIFQQQPDLLLLPSELEESTAVEDTPAPGCCQEDTNPGIHVSESFSAFLGEVTESEEEEAEDSDDLSDAALPAALRLPSEKAGWLRNVLSIYTADLQRDFFLVFVGRACYYCSVSCQVFMLYFMRDLMNVVDTAQQKSDVAALALYAQLMAAATAYPLGVWTQAYSGVRVYQAVLTMACVIMAFAYCCFLLVPLMHLGFYAMVLTALLYGVGNGCFLSADYALALCTLPDRRYAARALGLWGVSGFIGATFGPFAGGSILHFLGGTGKFAATGEEIYSWSGYAGLIGGGIGMTTVSALCILGVSPECEKRTKVSDSGRF